MTDKDLATAKSLLANKTVSYIFIKKGETESDTVKELNAKGIATESVRLDDYTGKKMTFFHDPDGLPLEIHE